jgi:hypothetical protein
MTTTVPLTTGDVFVIASNHNVSVCQKALKAIKGHCSVQMYFDMAANVDSSAGTVPTENCIAIVAIVEVSHAPKSATPTSSCNNCHSTYKAWAKQCKYETLMLMSVSARARQKCDSHTCEPQSITRSTVTHFRTVCKF